MYLYLRSNSKLNKEIITLGYTKANTEKYRDLILMRFGSAEQVVLLLTQPYWDTFIKVYFNNLYSSVPLMEKLYKKCLSVWDHMG